MRFLLTLLLVIGSSRAYAIDLDGQTEFSQRLRLNSSVSARVERVNVKVGQKVSAGELLLSLETTGLQAKVDIAGAQLDALRPTLARLATDLEKAQELFDRDSLAQVALQRAEQDHTIAAANVAAAAARLSLAQYHLGQAEIRAPIDGIVLELDAFPGLYVNTEVSNQVLLTLVDNESMIASALLPLEFWDQSRLPEAARIDFQKQSFPGRVIAIDSQITLGDNNHPALTLKVRFESNGKLPAGLPVQITLDDK